MSPVAEDAGCPDLFLTYSGKSEYLYLGNPVRQARPLTDKESEFFHYTSKRYVDLAAEYLKAMDQPD